MATVFYSDFIGESYKNVTSYVKQVVFSSKIKKKKG